MLELAAPSTKTLTRDDLDAMRRELWRRLGGLPARCELQVQQIERVDLGDIVREKLRYQVEPGEWVEGYVLRPSQIAPGDRLPAVVALHAHGAYFETGKMEIVDLYPEGYNRPSYAGWGVELARRGYVVICQDQICFEDRSWVARRGAELRGKDELLEGFQRIANGKTMVGKLAFDTSRAIDVLVARDDVDGNRIGVMGHSGGGIQSFSIMLFDPRASVAAINCGLGATAASIRDSRTSAFHGMIPGQNQLGDRAAVLATFAPRAVMLVNGSEDWLFPTDGVLNTYYRAKKAYRALGVEERLELTLFEGPHLFGDWVRDVGYQWIDRWLKQSPIDPEEIWYRGERPDPASVRTHQIDIEGLRDCCGRYSQVQPDPAPVVRRTAALREPADMAIEEVRITVDHFNAVDNKRPELEPPNVASEYLANIRCLVDLPDFIDLWIGKGLPGADGRRPATLVLHRSIDPYEVGRDEVFAMAGDASYALAPPLCKEGHLVAAMDLFGHATRKNPINQRRWKDQPERTILFPAVRYIDAGTSLLERTVHEIRCVVSYLQGRDDVDADRVNLVGFGTGGFVALMAAVLEPAVQSVVAVGGVTTQQAAIEAELFDHYFLYQPGLVPAGDVGAALSLLAPRSCRMILFDNDPQWPRRGAEEVQQAMRGAYAKAGCEEQLDLRTVAGKPRMDDQLTDQIVQWLR